MGQRKWYRPIGICHGSDYISWQSTVKHMMGPDFIGYLEVFTDNDHPPYQNGQNVINRNFIFFHKE